MSQAPSDKLSDKEYFKTWLADEELGGYTDQLNGFTIEKFGSFADQKIFKEELVSQLQIKNKVFDVATLNVAYKHAHSLLDSAASVDSNGKSEKRKIQTVDDIEKYLKPLINKVARGELHLDFRDVKKRLAETVTSNACAYQLPFDRMDISRYLALEKIAEHFKLDVDLRQYYAQIPESERKEFEENKDDEKKQETDDEDDEDETENEAKGAIRKKYYGIVSGAGCGKSHFCDYLVNEFYANESDFRKKYYLLCIPFADAMGKTRQDPELRPSNLLALVVYRLMFCYFVNVKSKSGSIVSKLKDYKDVFQDFVEDVCFKKYELDFKAILKNILAELKTQGKEVLLLLDDITDIATGSGKNESDMIEMLAGYCKVLWTSTIRFGRFSSGDQAKYMTLRPLNLQDRLIEYLTTQGVEIGHVGKVLLQMLGKHPRAFGIFYYLMKEDCNFHKYCSNSKESSMKNALDKYMKGWRSSNYGPTANLEAQWSMDRLTGLAFASFVCMHIFELDYLKCKSPFSTGQYKKSYWFTHFESHGMITQKKGEIYIAPIVLKAWADQVEEQIDLDDLVRNMARQIRLIFDTISSNEWGSGAVETLLGHMILLKLNCGKFLHHHEILASNSEKFQVGKFFGLPKSDKKDYGDCLLDFREMKPKHLSRVVRKKDREFFLQLGSPDTDEKKESGKSQGKQSKGKQKGKRNQGKPSLTKAERVRKQTAWIEDSVDGVKQSVTVASFIHNNISFDYLLILPLIDVAKFYLDDVKKCNLYKFVELKSRAEYENQVKGIPEATVNDGSLFKKKNPTTFKEQFEQFTQFMSESNYFSRTNDKNKSNSKGKGKGKGKGRDEEYVPNDVQWVLYCDFPITKHNSPYKTVEEVTLYLLGYTFGSFLKNFIVERTLWDWQKQVLVK